MKIIKTTFRINDELLDKIETYRKEKMFEFKNEAVISLLELGLIKSEEDKIIEEYLVQIIKQNNLILKKISGK